jgi:aminopeptidase-like protein
MQNLDAQSTVDAELQNIEALFDSLFPICRSITGDGNRESLRLLHEIIPLEIFEVPTGTNVFDWQIPQEWRVREAWIKDPEGRKIIDFSDCNLHIINYSEAVHKKVPLEELKKNIYTNPALPDAIPYVTSYYKRRWGFCMSHHQLQSLVDGEYEIYIDAEHFDGSLTYAHCILPGESEREILISSYICHPSMANNELSGPIASAFLYQRLKNWTHRKYTYRFVFIPETIGSISYLHQFGKELEQKLHAGFVLTCLGGDQHLNYKMSRRGDTALDRLMTHFQKFPFFPVEIREFTPINGSDERQYCSPGFNLPVGQFSRMVYAQYPEYHTSLDTKEKMTIQALQRSVEEIETMLTILETNGNYVNNFPYGEVKLDKHELYPDMNSYQTRTLSNNTLMDSRKALNLILYTLNYADGTRDLIEIAELAKVNVKEILYIIEILIQKKIVTPPSNHRGI